MRYSLDALVLGQVVNMSLFFVLKDSRNGGACAVGPETLFVDREATLTPQRTGPDTSHHHFETCIDSLV
jgi:hypothetical protein